MRTSRFHIIRYALAAALGLSAAAAHAQSSVVYDNGGPNHVSGNNMGIALQAEDFQLAAATQVTTVQFWSLEAPDTYRNRISYQIRHDASGSIGDLILQGFSTTATRTAVGSWLGLDEFRYSFDLSSPVPLVAGNYWLILHNGTLSNLGDPNEFLWETTTGRPGQSGGLEAFGAALPYTPNFQEHAFSISAVPEPGPVTAWAAGLAVLFAMRQCARNRQQG